MIHFVQGVLQLNAKKDNIVLTKSKVFAIRIIRVYQFLSTSKKEYVLSKQILKSGTAIGVLMREAEHAQSKADFLNKTNIALKEANETLFWLELLVETDYITKEQFYSLFKDCEDLLKLLVIIVKTTKKNLGR